MLTFPKSLVDGHKHTNRNLRWGQSFHQYAKLDKITSRADKFFCDKLYNEPDAKKAKNMVLGRTDQQN